ncbi:conserved hypothetical protein [Burkholderiales bacterium]|nr:conserved hypothetical protein [Burkholderiales bacterium]
MASIVDTITGWLGERLGRYLSHISHFHTPAAPADPEKLMACLQPGDVLLVEGQTRVSAVIKYLTQSTWSHAALFVGEATGLTDADGLPRCFLEADIRDGVRAVGVAEFKGLHCRVCRPIGLRADEIDTVIGFALARLGSRYDLKNVIDLARYLMPAPTVPLRWRRRMLALGSGDPTRAICSTLIAQAFEAVRYPILPIVESVPSKDPLCPGCVDEILHVRHHSLYVPRDFDVSPYFALIKPTLAAGFDHRALTWQPAAPGAAARIGRAPPGRPATA